MVFFYNKRKINSICKASVESFHWRFYFFYLFSFLPKLSQTFLYLEVEKATDQKFESKSRISTLIIKWACQFAGVLPDRIPDKSKDNRSEDACDGANGLGVPFKDKFDKTLKLYSLMTTKPEEVEARKQKEMEE